MPAASVPGHEPPSYVCPFCAIVAGRGDPPFTVQDDVVDRTAVTTAWIGSRWWERNPGHVIVVPNEHVENMYALRQELAGAIHETARPSRSPPSGVRLRGDLDPPAQRARRLSGDLALPPARVSALRGGRPVRRFVAHDDACRTPAVRRAPAGRARPRRLNRRQCQTPIFVKAEACRLCADRSTPCRTAVVAYIVNAHGPRTSGVVRRFDLPRIRSR